MHLDPSMIDGGVEHINHVPYTLTIIRLIAQSSTSSIFDFDFD